MEHGYLDEVLILFGLAIVLVALLRRLHLPPILGYLAVGLIAGPHGFGWLAFDEVTYFLGELGIVFLLFTIGLEFSWPLLLSMRKELFGVGSLQVAGGAVAGMAIALAFGESWQAALIFGAATAMSSTAIVLKQLAEQMELSAHHGRLSVGILLFQDLAAIPFLIMIPILAAGGSNLAPALGAALLKGLAVLLLVILVGRRVLPIILHHSAAARSGELFTLTALFVTLATAWLTGLFGLSLALGAFLAGMLLSETAYRHQVESDVRPFRDLLLGLFFVAVGMELDYRLLPQVWLETTVLTLGIVVGKGLLIVLLVRGMGHDLGMALRTGITLGHGGEFGIALLALALAEGLIDHRTVQPVLAAMIISMLIAAMLVRANGPIVRRLAPRAFLRGAAGESHALRAGAEGLDRHVIIAGFGRVGQNVAALLRILNVDYIALDLSPDVVREACDAGEPVYFGNATHRGVLGAAGMRRAQALLVSFDEPQAVERVLRTAQAINPDIYTVLRARRDRDYEALIAGGADAVVPEALEASMAVAGQLLRGVGFAESDIEPLIERIREDRYRQLRRFYHGAESSPTAATHRNRLRTLVLPAHVCAVESQLSELGLEELGVKVVALRRGGVRSEQPTAEMRLQPGDALVLEGSPKALQRAERELLAG